MLHEPLSQRQDNFVVAEEVIAQNTTELTNIAESLTNTLYHYQLRDTYCCGLIAVIKLSQLDEKRNEMAC